MGFTVLTVAIDPGLTGAYAVLDASGSLVTVDDLPVIRDGRLGWIDGDAFTSALLEVRGGHELHALVERITPLPVNGRMGAFSQGCTLGSILAALQIARARIELVQPSVWKRHYSLSTDKDASIAKARLLFPHASLDRKKDHGKAEALLLAHFAQTRRTAA